jgi:hypothetical protein
MSQVETTKFKLMDSLYYFKDSLINILADRISSDFNMQKDNARWRVIHSTKLAKEFFKHDFTVNSIIFVIAQKTGLYIRPEDLRTCNNVDDILKFMKKADDAWKAIIKERERLLNKFISKWSEKNSDFIQQESIT